MENLKEQISNVHDLIGTYKKLHKLGIGIGDICKLINWPEALKLAEKSGQAWLVIVVRIAQGFCLLSPKHAEVIEEIVDTVDRSLA